MSNVKALYHIVFCTKGRRMTITNEYREDLYRVIWNNLTEMKCKLVRISGIPNHLHILLNLNPSVSLSGLMSKLKARTSLWLKNDPRFPHFEGWAHEYFATSISRDDQDRVIEYIKGQQEHHTRETFETELDRVMQACGLELHEKSMI